MIDEENKAKYHKNYNHHVRIKAIEILGGKCIRCGNDDWRVLQIDHVNGDAVKEREQGKLGYSTYRICLSIINGKTRFEYQLLCANCNWIKRYENNENKNQHTMV